MQVWSRMVEHPRHGSESGYLMPRMQQEAEGRPVASPGPRHLFGWEVSGQVVQELSHQDSLGVLRGAPMEGHC